MRRIFLAGLACAFWVLSSAGAWAQGAWLPSNADFSYPRTLLKLNEVPAAINWIDSNPEMHYFYRLLYQGATGQNVNQLVSNSERRIAAHIAKNCAFIYLLNRKPLLPSGLDTLTTQEQSFYRDKALLMLNRINTNVETYPDFGNYIWRSNELTDNLIAYDLLKGAGVPDSLLAEGRRRLHQYLTNFHTQVAFNTFGLGLTSLHVDNHTLRSVGAIGMGAVVLNDADSSNTNGRANTWIQTALYQIDNVLWRSNVRQSDPGVIAGYSEGPHYLRFGMRHSLEFFHAMGNFLPDTTLSVTFESTTRSVRHPFYDPNFDLLWEWVMRIGMPDGRDPQIEDCFAQTHNADMTFMEKPQFRPTYHGTRLTPLAPNTLWEQLHHSSDDIVADYISAMTPYGASPYPLMQVLPQSGDLIMRNGWDTTSTYFHVEAKHGRTRTSANGHNHVDVTSFILHARGQELAIDPGYIQWERRTEVDGAGHHNMILVDGIGPTSASTGNAGDADGFIERDFAFEHLFYAEVRTSYANTTIIRKPMMVRGDYILMADELSSGQAHNYQWQLHALGLIGGDSTRGTCVIDSNAVQATYTKNGVNLRAVITARDGLSSFLSQTNVHELRYDSIEHHTQILAGKAGTANTGFLAALIPYEADTPSITKICGPSCDAIRISRDGYLDIGFLGNGVASNASGLSQDLSSDAKASFYSQSPAGDWAQWMLQAGTLLQYGPDTLAFASVNSNWALAVRDSVSYEGHAGAAGTLYLYDLNFVPQSVLGFGVVQSWTYEANLGRLVIQIAGPGNFTILKDYVLGNVALAEAAMRIFPNPSAGKFSVVLPQASLGGEWHLLGLDGKLLEIGSFGAAQFEVALRQKAAGIYFLEVIDLQGNFIGIEKLILE